MQYKKNKVFQRTKSILFCKEGSFPNPQIINALKNQGMRNKDAEFICAILASIDEKGIIALNGITQMILDDCIGVFPS
jgi:hypothetical protein